MKSVQVFLCFVLALAVLASAAFVNAGADRDQPERVVESLKVKNLTIVNSQGKGVITMMDTGRGPGIWMTSPSGNHVILTAIEGQTAIYVMGKDSKASDLAICLSEFGGPGYLQARRANGDFIMIDPEKLIQSK